MYTACMTIILAIETATPACSAALICGGQVTERFEIAPRRHTDLILPMIDDLFVNQGVCKSELDAIAFGCGPGSFMGTRLATGIAQGLGYALDCPLVPISTLQILAQTVFQQHNCTEPLVVGWDARMDEIYWGVYRAANGLMEQVSPDTLTTVASVTKPVEPYVMAGNAWTVYEADVDRTLLEGASQLITDVYPRAAGLLPFAVERLKLGSVMVADAVEPIYLRQSVVS